MEKVRYWIIVASKDHAATGIKQGIAQACHGKAAPLKRMKVNDKVLIYSSKEHFGEEEKCQKFTAIGCVKDEVVYAYNMGNGFVPYRRNINWYTSKEVSIVPLIETLDFIENKKQWGYPFRYGFFEINEHDYALIAAGMLEAQPA
jgi:predicted RNA-binding protein